MNSNSTTNLSLLLRLRDETANEEAWRAFVDRYGSRIYAWCLNRKLQPADAEDVTQEVLSKLARSMRSFEYDHSCSFRAWLRRITENALNDFFRDQQRAGRVRGTTTLDQVSVCDRQDLYDRLESAFDLDLLDLAIDRVRNRVADQRYAAWQLMASEQLSGAEVAKRLNMKTATVYAAKYQVQKMIQEEIRRLES